MRIKKKPRYDSVLEKMRIELVPSCRSDALFTYLDAETAQQSDTWLRGSNDVRIGSTVKNTKLND